MTDGIKSFLLTFVPLFIAVDALGNVPFFMSLTEGMSAAEQRKTAHIAVGTAAVVGLAFLFFGRFILSLMGISVGSFAIAGGIVLLVLSIKYLTTGRMVELIKEEMVAVVPIGTPLTVGPATITTLLLLTSEFPLALVLLSFLLNLVISWGSFLLSQRIVRFMGQGGLKAVSKVFSLLLAAIAVTMVIRGLSLVGILKDISLVLE
jgi:multiple antibiotic resistance protein